MVEVYSKDDCIQCDATKIMLVEGGVLFVETNMTADSAAVERVKALGFLQAPVIIVTNEHGATTDSWSGFRPEKIATL